MRGNTKRLTSPFDLHATFSHVLSYPDIPQNLSHGISLFQKIPETRTCADCGIPEYYCPCIHWRDVNTGHPHIKYAAQAAVQVINNLTSSDHRSSELCERLTLKEITRSYQSLTNKKFKQFLRHQDADGRVAAFSDKDTHKGECSYIIQFRTEPGDGFFEAPIGILDREFRVLGDISRINMYGDQPKCIAAERPDLRKFCYCKNS